MNKIIRLVCALLLVMLVPVNSWAVSDQVQFTHNLQKDGQLAQSRGVPLLIIFTSPDCSYCDQVIQDYLIPMQRNPQYAQKVMIRRIQISDETRLINWDGTPTTSKQYAAKLAIKLTPVVIVFSADGAAAADPLIGLGPADYYGGYLDAAIDAGLSKVHTAAH